MNQTLPKDIDVPGVDNHKSPCEFIRFFNKSFIENPHGRISIDVNIGLKDLCMFIQLSDYGGFDNVLPQFYTCKKHDFLDKENINVIKKLYHKGDSSKKLFDKSMESM